MKIQIPIWFQLCYAIWQFIRSAKLFKLAYGIPYHLVLYCRQKVKFVPFSKVSCGMIKPGKKHRFSLDEEEKKLALRDPEIQAKFRIERSGGLINANVERSPKTVGDFGKFHYIVPKSKDYLLAELLHHQPAALALSGDYITEGFWIMNCDNQETLLEKVLCPDFYIDERKWRVLLYPSENSTLNQNFVRILSISPLVLVSRGMPTASTWFSIGLIVMDLLFNALLQSVCSEVQRGLVFVFRGILKRVPHRRFRYYLSLFLYSISESMNICDTLAGNFYDVEKGSLALLNNFGHPDYCEAAEGTELGESKLTEKPLDEVVSEAFARETAHLFPSLSYPPTCSHYVEVETGCGKIFMGYNRGKKVCIFPVNRALNSFHYIGLPHGGVDQMLKVLSFINEQHSNVLDIGRDGYAHSVSLGELVDVAVFNEISPLQVVRMTRKITVAGRSGRRFMTL